MGISRRWGQLPRKTYDTYPAHLDHSHEEVLARLASAGSLAAAESLRVTPLETGQPDEAEVIRALAEEELRREIGII